MQVHRFRNLVAVSTGSGPTTYLTHKEATALAKAINKASREIKMGIPFGESRVGTWELKLPTDAASSARED